MASFKHYWHIFVVFRKLRFMKMLVYRNDFIFWSVVSLFWTLFNVLFLTLIIGVQNTIGGWTRPELYLLFAFYTMLDAFTWSYFHATMHNYTWSIFSGYMDIILTKPVDPQFFLSVQENNYNNAPRFIVGLIILIWAIVQLPQPPTFWQISMCILLGMVSLVLLYSIWFLLATTAFWVEKLENINEIVPAFRSIFEMPRTIYTGIFSTIFTVIVPLALLTSVPSEVLLGRASLSWVVYFIGSTILFFTLARWFFVFSLRKYSGVGS